MKTTKRFNEAVTKLYNAFHSKTLFPECCKQCAVGNILDNTDRWKYFSDAHGSTQLNYVGLVHQRLGKTYNGYTPLELLTIEYTFLKACSYKTPLGRATKKPSLSQDLLFNGLSAVISLLCTLDGKKDEMNIKNLLDYNPKKKRSFNKPALCYKL